MKILQINASARSEGAHSTNVANSIVARLRAEDRQASLMVRDLASAPLLPQDEATLVALGTPASERTPEQAERVAFDDALIDEVKEADVLVLGIPMYNFGVPVQFKNWIDAIARAGVTFRYTENGPQGLLTGKKVYLAMARGGRHRGAETDTQVPYLKTVLGFLGMTDLHFIYAEGLNMGPEAMKQGLAEAEADLAAAFA